MNQSTITRRSFGWKAAYVVTFGIFSIAPAALAHGGAEHVMGTISAVAENSITVTTAKGETVQIALDAKTKYLKGDKASERSELKPGDRVVVHAAKKNGSLLAQEVKTGTGAPATKAATKKPKP